MYLGCRTQKGIQNTLTGWRHPNPVVSLVIGELMAGQLFVSHCSSTSVKYFCGIKKQICDLVRVDEGK